MTAPIEPSTDRVAPDRLHPVQHQLRHRGARSTGRRFARIRGDKAHPASQGYTCEKALRLDHYQNGRDRLTSPLRRRADGTFEPIDWDTAIARGRRAPRRRSATRTAARGSSITAAAARATTSAAPTARATRAALGSIYIVQRAGAGEDRRVLGRRPALRPARAATPPATSSTPRWRVFVGKNPWQSHGFPRARADRSRRSPRDPGPRAHRHRSAPHRDRRARRLSICRCGRAPTRSASSALLGVLVQEDLVDHAFLARAHHATATPCCAALAGVAVAEYCRSAAASPRRDVRAVGPAHRARAESVSIFEDLGIQQAPHCTLNSYLEKLVYLLTGNFAKPRRDEHPHRAWPASAAAAGRRPRTTPGRRASASSPA